MKNDFEPQIVPPKRYTVVYTESWMAGCHQQVIVNYVQIECDDIKHIDDLLLSEYKIDTPQIVLIFDGWPNQV